MRLHFSISILLYYSLRQLDNAGDNFADTNFRRIDLDTILGSYQWRYLPRFILRVVIRDPLRKPQHLRPLMRAESPGPSTDKLVPRVANNAKILYGIYVGLSALMVIALLLFLNKSKMGRAIRALGDDHQAALSVGISLSTIWVIVWFIAGVVALVALKWLARPGADDDDDAPD